MGEKSTKKRILEAARDVFLEKGIDGARMQAIANRAGINKALLHYYYQSKNQLFAASIEDLLRQMIPKIFGVFATELPFEEKLFAIAKNYTEFILTNPKLPLLILNEANKTSSLLFKNFTLAEVLNLEQLQTQLDKEAKAGRIRPIHVSEFMMNMISMLIFPHVGKPIIQHALSLNDEQYHQIIRQRIEQVPLFILKALRP